MKKFLALLIAAMVMVSPLAGLTAVLAEGDVLQDDGQVLVIEEPAAEETAEPAVEETAEPAVEETAEPAVEETAEPAVEETAELAVEETAEPAVEETAEPVVEETAEPVVEETAEPAVEETAEPAVEETAEHVVEETAEPAVEETAEPVVEETAETAVEETAEPVVEETAEPAVEETDAPVIEEPIVRPPHEFPSQVEYVEGVIAASAAVGAAEQTAPFTEVYATLDSTTLAVGAEATWTVTVKGGVAPYTFEYSLYSQALTDTSRVYSLIGDSQKTSDSNVYSYVIPEAGRYFLQYVVTDATGASVTVNDHRYETASDALKQKVAEIVAECTTDGMSDYQMALNLHDWLCENASYDDSLTIYDPSGVLLQGTGVCESFALAYEMLLKEVDIDTAYVTGQANGGPHAWNMVKLGGEWYHVDVTWDEEKNDRYYFGMSTELISRDHTIEDSVPNATATRYNYVLQHSDGAFHEVSEIPELLNALPGSQTEFQFYYLGTGDVWDEYVAWFQANGNEYGLTSVGYSGSGVYTKYVSGTRVAREDQPTAVPTVTPTAEPATKPVLVSVIPSVAEAEIGQSVTWKVDAHGGKGELQYNYVLLKDNKSYKSFGWSKEAELTFEFTEAGSYKLQVRAKDAAEERSDYKYSKAVTVTEAKPTPEPTAVQTPKPVAEKPVLASITASMDKAGVGQSVTWKIDAYGGEGELQYNYVLLKDNKSYKSFGWSKEAELTFEFTEVGSYKLQVRAKDAKEQRSEYKYSKAIEVQAEPVATPEPTPTPSATPTPGPTSEIPVLVGVTASAAEAEVGQSITWTSEAYGGKGELQYNYVLLKDNKSYKTFSWQASNELTFEFTEPGSYKLQVRVKDAAEQRSEYKYSKAVTVIEAPQVEMTYEVVADGAGIAITKYLGTGAEVVIPDTIDGLPVIEIGDEAFYNNTTLTTITLPATIERIGVRAFAGCTSLHTMK